MKYLTITGTSAGTSAIAFLFLAAPAPAPDPGINWKYLRLTWRQLLSSIKLNLSGMLVRFLEYRGVPFLRGNCKSSSFMD